MKRPVHLIHFSDRPGGIEVLLPEMISSLPGMCFDAFVIRVEKHGYSVYKDAGIGVRYGSNTNMVAWMKLFRFVRSHKNELFHVFNIGPVFLMIMKLAGAENIIYSIHGTRYWKSRIQEMIYRVLWKLVLTRNIRLIANSEFSGSVFKNYFRPQNEPTLLYNPIDSQHFFPSAHTGDNPVTRIIYCGRLDEGKNLFTWIDVAVEVHKQLPHTSFAIYGDGALKELLAEKITALDAGEYIHMKGLVKNMPEVYRSAGLLLFLSEYESFGNVVVESILSGTPVLVLPIPAMLEIFRDFPLFLLNVEEDLARQVTDKIRQLNILKRETRRAIPSFQTRFSRTRHMEALQNIYQHAGFSHS